MSMYNYHTKPEAELQYLEICSVDELPAGERLFFVVGDTSVVLLHMGGQYFAIADKCSHDDGPVGDGEVEDCEIICPRHGARFDLTSGKATKMPAVEDIPAFPVQIKDGKILVGFPL